MKTTPSRLWAALTLVLGFIAADTANAQTPAPPQVEQIRPGIVETKPLSTNYRIKWLAKAGEHLLGELSALSCSGTVQFSGPLDSSSEPTIVQVTGTLGEKEAGKLLFDYDLLLSIPIVTNKVTVGTPGYSQALADTQYQSHMASGTLLMKPGQPYQISKAGGVTYSVTITAEPAE